jgi:hypothetical protein
MAIVRPEGLGILKTLINFIGTLISVCYFKTSSSTRRVHHVEYQIQEEYNLLGCYTL